MGPKCKGRSISKAHSFATNLTENLSASGPALLCVSLQATLHGQAKNQAETQVQQLAQQANLHAQASVQAAVQAEQLKKTLAGEPRLLFLGVLGLGVWWGTNVLQVGAGVKRLAGSKLTGRCRPSGLSLDVFLSSAQNYLEVNRECLVVLLTAFACCSPAGVGPLGSAGSCDCGEPGGSGAGTR